VLQLPLLLGFMVVVCDVISAVTEFMVRVLQLPLLLEFMMLCGIISAVAEFMVSVLQIPLLLGCTMLLVLMPCRTYDPITCLSGVPPPHHLR
jgi:hypothetical protein